MSLAPITGPADIRDQKWLDERIADIEQGVDAVLDIAHNWHDGRHLSRLHPGLSAAQYVREHVGTLRLGKAEVTVLLAETNWSNRQIAAVAGVDEGTVRNVKRTAEYSAVPIERPAETLGADNVLRSYPAPEPQEDDNELDLTDVPNAAVDALAQWVRDLHRYAKGFEHVAPPSRIDPAKYRRKRRMLLAGVSDLIDHLARDD